ncbi:MAG: hypothetical protein IKA36_04530 [Clostridia bacterium]|nr:hypothetical protein [Clostridia bacterium]
MTIVIPEDENINEVVIDVRDVLHGAELEFNPEKEFETVFNSKSDIINNDFQTEFIFTIQKTDFEFDSKDKTFIHNIKKIIKNIKTEVLSILEEKYKRMKKMLKNDIETGYNSSKKEFESHSTGFNRKFLRHIREQFSNIVDSGRCEVMLMKRGEAVILGEPIFQSSTQLVAISSVNTSKKLGLDNPDLRNIKITNLGFCPEKSLILTLDGVTKDKKKYFKYNKYLNTRLERYQEYEAEMEI